MNPMNRREFWASLCAAFGYAVTPKPPAPLTMTYPKGPEQGEKWWTVNDDQPVFTPVPSGAVIVNGSDLGDHWQRITIRHSILPDGTTFTTEWRNAL